MNISEMLDGLDILGSSSCLDVDYKIAAQRAALFIRAVRGELELDWKTNVNDLHTIGSNILPNDHLKRWLQG